MRRHIPPALAVVAAAVVGLGATSCGLLSSDSGSQVAQAGQNDPGKGGSEGPVAGGTMAGGTMAGGTMAGGTMAGGTMTGGTMTGGTMTGGTMTAPARSTSATDEVARVAALLQAGIQQARQKNWAGATTSFRVVLAIDPKNVYALYDLGVIAETDNDGVQAIGYYDQALSANGKYTPAMYNKAILLETSRPRQAIALYNQIIAINPRASTAYLRMAFVEAELGDQAQARVADAKAVTIDPGLGQYRLPVKKN